MYVFLDAYSGVKTPILAFILLLVLTVTSGDRETELLSDLLDKNNIRHYAASIF